MRFDFSELSPQNAYKLMVSTIVPRPIAWVVTQNLEGAINGAPFSFFNAFSSNPPILGIGVGLRPTGEPKDTAINIELTGEFVINLVSEELAERMNVTAVDFEYGVDELAHAGLTPLASSLVRPPRIGESPVAYECQKYELLRVGDGNSIILGRAVAIHIRDDLVLDPEKCYIDSPRLHLIGRLYGTGWYTRLTDTFDMPRLKKPASS